MIAVLSDIHANLPALQAVIQDAIAHGCTRFISLGDVVSYGAQPGECIDLLRSHGVTNILGNHDGYIVHGIGCPRSKAVSVTLEHHRKVVTAAQLDWLRQSLPLLQEETTLYLHGGPDDPQDQYLYRVTREVFPTGIRTLLSGHTHVQTLASFGDLTYCNPGSVGQPRDGDPRAAYALIVAGKILLRRVPYDIDAAVAAMKRVGYEAYYYENLYMGAQIGGRIDRVKVVT
jgi:predicted phosphodiesterase